ncbi:hypothetical protein M404DRAFT_830412 [Pisolithus tinctorius Marx 270]|uniref:Uncharacterized protein n=1 Tax=Pisolithus tinctorius Marx 270 TaxID=870435 RepID=A0A0C3PBH3_PISTI|nr:hypothetical protein M404DRAFT_830412 [Pisolithus tinctorius Marx 270]
MSIMSTRSLPTLQPEPVVPDPPAIQSRHSSAERSCSSPHAQPQSRWPCGRGQSPSHPRSRSRSQTRTARYVITLEGAHIHIQPIAHSLLPHRRRPCTRALVHIRGRHIHTSVPNRSGRAAAVACPGALEERVNAACHMNSVMLFFLLLLLMDLTVSSMDLPTS